MSIEAGALLVTVMIFILGLTYHAGRQSMRLDKFDEWRTELKADIHGLFQSVRRLERLIQHDEEES